MNEREVSPVVKGIWLTSLFYLVMLLVGVGFVFPNLFVPMWVEWLLKVTAIFAFLVVVMIPLLHLAMKAWTKKRSKALIVAGTVTVGAYMLLLAQMIYVKVKTCDEHSLLHDDRWHCNVSGKGVVASIILIPLVAALIGLLVGALNRLRRRPPHG